MCPKIRWDGSDENFSGGELNKALYLKIKEGVKIISNESKGST